MREQPIGTRVFNRGDMANIEHWGTITAIHRSERFHDEYEITPDEDAERDPYTIPISMVYENDKGNGLTRFVTEVAYWTRRAKQLRQSESVYGSNSELTEAIRQADNRASTAKAVQS